MPNDLLTIKHLRSQVGELRERFKNLPEEDVFVIWFMRAYVTDDEKLAADSLTNGSKDKGIDGILLDHKSHSVVLVQAKYRTNGKALEKRADVVDFAHLAKLLSTEDDADFIQSVDGIDPLVAGKLKEARKAILKKGYRLWLYYITLGSVSLNIRKEAQALVQKARIEARMEIFTDRRMMLILRDYLDGVAPPIPMLDLEMESGQGVKVNGVLDRYDHKGEIESWVFSMRGDAIAEIVEIGSIRLFARNIRGFLGGDTPVNRGMHGTLHKEPERFFYYNNGITILCDKAEKVSKKGIDVLRVSNPQIINGQQTTRTLASVEKKAAAKSSVLVKVIQVPREDGSHDGFESLVSRIVAGTNWQNSISQSDLMSNDGVQIALERELRKYGYLYIRKRQSKTEARHLAGCKYLRAITKDELAKAVAGCELDPVISRSGKDNLYEESLYSCIFSNSEPLGYLSRYWTMKAVSDCSKGYPERGYAKWMVQNHVWSHISPLVRAHVNADRFRNFCEYGDRYDLWRVLKSAINKVFVEAGKYYRQNRGRGATAMDPSRFYRNKRGRDKEFNEFIRVNGKKTEAYLHKSMARIEKLIQEAEF